MKSFFCRFLFAILLVPLSVSFAKSFREAPNNGFIKKGVESPEAQRLQEKFRSGSGAAYTSEQLSPLQAEDFYKIDEVPLPYRVRARQLFQEGKVVVVDSVVGNATRLGNPPGGKGAVEIAEGLTFLDAKIIRLAVDSAYLGTPIPHILWTSEENQEAVKALLNSLAERVLNHSALSTDVKRAVRSYLDAQKTILMAQADLLPVIDEKGQLSEERYRNLGAGEMVPTIFNSGADDEVKLASDSVLIFSNIDFDVDYFEVVSASLWAGRPDLMQVHVPTQASGGSAYWFNENGQQRIVPLEGIEVPEEILKQAKTLNSNTVVMQGKALQPESYLHLPIPFEKKDYNGKSYYLPKLSLSDIGKHPDVKTAVALGSVEKYFFTGSKNLERLEAEGENEIQRRIGRWNQRLRSVGGPSAGPWACQAPLTQL